MDSVSSSDSDFVSFNARKLTIGDAVATPNVTHGVHVMIWAPERERLVLQQYPARAAVLMQMRFDGTFGFPGGEVDEPIDGLKPAKAMAKMTSALYRELEEEVNIDEDFSKKNPPEYVFSTRYELDDKIICHFFTLQVTMAQLQEIERKSIYARDYGDEVMGHIRVPLHTMSNGDAGFPRFLRNEFVGCAKEQLYHGLIASKIFTLAEIQTLDTTFSL